MKTIVRDVRFFTSEKSNEHFSKSLGTSPVTYTHFSYDLPVTRYT